MLRVFGNGPPQHSAIRLSGYAHLDALVDALIQLDMELVAELDDYGEALR
jgi:hypothetical protein